MAGGQERILRRRISATESTKKITRAMELIAATRVVQAQERTRKARPYAEQITNVILDLAGAGASSSHPLLAERPGGGKAAFVVVTSDRGLAGAYNSAVIRAAEREIQAARTEGLDYSLFLVGKKALTYFRFRGYRIDHVFLSKTDRPTYEDAREIGQAVRTAFEGGELDRVDLVYTRFISAGSQRVVVRRFLPLEIDDADDSNAAPRADFEFEPSPDGILDELVPRYVEARLYAALLDASASEHASRQRAMKAATDNAEELIIALSRAMNRARQDAITTEIMEIVGGAEALAQTGAGEDDLLPDHILSSHLFPAHHSPDHRRAS
ncbi:MAG TPA: F0F1 ATP synthase subunit gamma [Acidimicrobiales bacterium]|nr:F0F1 ATP synthase subunit gamma [Acidimicrobiales bacterium]